MWLSTRKKEKAEKEYREFRVGGCVCIGEGLK